MNIRTELLHAMKDLAIDTDHIRSETRLREDLEMDSTELVELAVVLEKRLSLSIDDTILGKLSTFGEVEQFLESLASDSKNCSTSPKVDSLPRMVSSIESDKRFSSTTANSTSSVESISRSSLKRVSLLI